MCCASYGEALELIERCLRGCRLRLFLLSRFWLRMTWAPATGAVAQAGSRYLTRAQPAARAGTSTMTPHLQAILIRFDADVGLPPQQNFCAQLAFSGTEGGLRPDPRPT